MKKIFLMALAAIALNACNTQPQFKVRGSVDGANGKMLYLEASALDGIVPLDSVKLSSTGSYSFKAKSPSAPEFYRLRVDNKVINFSIDSTETLQINAPYIDFATAYQVEGSVNSSKMKDLVLKQQELQKNADVLGKAVQNRQMNIEAYQERMLALVKNYKQDVREQFIYVNPGATSSYFALFQTLNNYPIFDLGDRDDLRCFQAVATSLDNFHPHADRSKNLYNMVIKAMKNKREAQPQTVELPEDVVANEVGIIDIALRDMKGNVRKLSDLKGKVVLVDFTAYQAEYSAAHNIFLNELYQKYASKGLEIYQISLDANEHYWKTVADNLPWICVRDAASLESQIAATYNVHNLPTLFLVNRASELSARGEMVKDLEEAVKKLL